MQILEDNTRNGELVVLVENLDDLWVLYNVLRPGDRIRGRTFRRVVIREGEAGDRRPMVLTINVEKVEFHEFANYLRVLGAILEGPDDFVAIGQHHTFNLEPGDKISIFKEEWLRNDVERIRRNLGRKSALLVMIIAIESGLANIALLSNYSLTPVTEISENIPGKRYEKQYQKEAMNEFYNHVSLVVKENLERHQIQVIIVCGPGFTKEHYLEQLREELKNTKYSVDIRAMNASSGELSAIYEILRNGTVTTICTDFQVAKDEMLLADFIERLGRDSGTVTYGMKPVCLAAQMGAIEKLLICDVLLRTGDNEQRKIIDDTLNLTEQNRGEVHILSTANPAGDQLQRYGKIAAILRFKVDTNVDE
jgi:protein pelota